MSRLALLGGPKAVTADIPELFRWPIVNKAMEDGVLAVLRTGTMSGIDLSQKFEEAFARWHKVKHGLACSTGTAALHCAFFGAGVGTGDEVICPSLTYWASALPVYALGATVVFADVHPETLTVDPADVERKITSRTKAIVVVHYVGYPCDMDAIMKIARRRKVRVIEDCSHAHGALHRGRMVGTFGDVSAFSTMSGKSFAIGEAGVLITNDREIYERAILFGHYERHSQITLDHLKDGAGLPWGGYKYRMHQMSSAVGIEQVKKYPKEMAEIDRAMNRFWDLLEGVPGVRAHRPPAGSRTTMGGWYAPLGRYVSSELGGLSVTRFCEALRAEGFPAHPGCNRPLHLHPLFRTVDVYGDGKPTRRRNAPGDPVKRDGRLPVTVGVGERVFSVPWFKKFRPAAIRPYAEAVKKVSAGYRELLPGDTGNPATVSGWALSFRR